MTQNILLQKQLKKLSKILVYFVLTISFIIFLGHLFSPQILKIICFGSISMVPLASVAYIFTCFAYLIAISEKKGLLKSVIHRILCIALIIFGAIVVFSILFGLSIPFLSQVVNRNSFLIQKLKIPPVATCFSFYGIAILLLNYETKGKKNLAQYFVIPPLFLGFYLFLSYLYSSSALVRGTISLPISIYSSFFNIIIPFAIFFTYPDKGFAGEITRTKTGGKTFFNLLPGIVLLPIIIGLIHINYFPTPFGLGLIILIFIAFGFLVIYYNLSILNNDLQERLRVQSDLKNSLTDVSHLTELIERSTDAIIIIDENYIINRWNKGAEKIYGYSAAEVLGKNKYELLDSPYMNWEQFLQGVSMLYKLGGERTSTRYQQTKSGKRITILQSSVLLKDEEGNIKGYIGVGKDITELEEKEEKLAILNAELNTLINAKTAELNSVYERISDAVIVLDTNWCYTYYNKMAFKITQQTAKIQNNLIGMNIWTTFPFIVGTALYDAYHESMKEQVSKRIEYYYTEFDMWTEQTIYPTLDGISVFLRDITEKKLAEIKQKDAEEKYKTIVETSQEGILIRDTNGIITYVNDYLVRMLKESREYLIGLPLLNLFSDENLRIMQTNMERRNRGFSDTYDLSLPLRDGSFITVYIKSTPYLEKGVFAGSLSTITDITDIKKKELELKQLSEDLRSLSFYLQNIREEERKKIAQEIHDELGQNLAILKMDVSWIGKHIDVNNKELSERLEQFKKITDDTVQTSRRLYNYLYPQMLDDIGLVRTIQWHANSYIIPGNIHFVFNTALSDEVLPQYHTICLVLYRIYQECTTNIIRYAKATTITIDLYYADDRLIMSVQDDGVGFEIDKVDTKLHHGLLGMRERVYSLNGSIIIDTGINKGTKVTVSIPVPVIVEQEFTSLK